MPATPSQAMTLPLDERTAARAARKAAPDTAGRRWFDLPATPITPQVPLLPPSVACGRGGALVTRHCCQALEICGYNGACYLG